jgi:peroxiredoxin
VLAPGAAFPDASLPDPEGASHRLSQAWSRGAALLVVGHADCGTTRLALPSLERLHTRGGNVAAILQDDAETSRELAAELGLTLPIRLEFDPYPLSAALGVEVVPSYYLVGRDGAVVRTAHGFSREDLDAFASALGIGGPLFAVDEPGPRYRPG